MKKLILVVWLLLAAVAYPLRADINGDCRVDILDFAILMSEWMQEDEDCIMGLGTELVTNGGFADGTGWDADAGWTVLGGTANFTGTDGGINQDSIGLVAGRAYRVTYTVSEYGGVNSIYAKVGGTKSGYVGGNGDKSHTVFAGATDTFSIETFGAGSTLKIDNVSVKEVLGGMAMSGAEFMDDTEDW